MSKHIKNEITAIKNIILKYGIKIPPNNITKFDKDIKMIFQEVEDTIDYDSLEQIKNLAKTKLSSLKRLYGDLENESQEKIQKKVDEDIFRISHLKVNVSNKDDFKQNNESVKNIEEYNDTKYFDEISKIVRDIESHEQEAMKSDYDKKICFNKEKVEEYRKKSDEMNMILYKIVKEREDKLKESNVNSEGKKGLTPDMMKSMISEILKSNNIDEKMMENFDFDSFAKSANLGNLEKSSPLDFMKNIPKELNKNKIGEEEEPSPEEKEKIRQLLNDNEMKSKSF